MKRYHTFGELLKAYRRHLGKTQSDFAAQLHVSERHYRRLEQDEMNGSMRVNKDLLSDIAKATGIPYVVLLNVAGENPIFFDCETRRYAFGETDLEIVDLANLRHVLEQPDMLTNDPMLRIVPLRASPFPIESLSELLEYDAQFYPPVKHVPLRCFELAATLCPELNFLIKHHSVLGGGCLCFPITNAAGHLVRAGALRYTDLREGHFIRQAAELPQSSLMLFTLFAPHVRVFTALFIHAYHFLRQQTWSPESYLSAYATWQIDAEMCEAIGMTCCYESPEDQRAYRFAIAPRLYAMPLQDFMRQVRNEGVESRT